MAPEAPPVDLSEILNRIAAGGDEASLMAQLVDGADVSREPTENRHVPGQIDTLVTARYPGLEIEAYQITGGRTFIREVTVTDERYRTADGLGVGATRSEIERAAGEPTQTTVGSPIYELGDGPTSTTLEVNYDASGRAERLVWRPYVD